MSSRNYWLGANEVETSVWRWVTGEPWSYTHWGTGQPDNSQQDTGVPESYLQLCVGWGGYWNDSAVKQDRTAKIGLICEWDVKHSDWVEDIDDDIIPPDFPSDWTQPITRAEFAAVAVKVYEKLAATSALPAVINPFTDTKNVEVLKAYNVGIVNGYGNGRYGPNDRLNREQCAAMLTRVFKRVTMPGWTLEQDAQFPLEYQMPAPFADDDLISPWAKNSVYFMVVNNIIKGVGDNKFAPYNNTTKEEAEGYATATREQALIIATRMVRNLK